MGASVSTTPSPTPSISMSNSVSMSLRVTCSPTISLSVSLTPSLTPSPSPPPMVNALYGGGFHACAVTSGSVTYCWGMNGNGQLGDGTTADKWTPVLVSGLSSSGQWMSGGYGHTCALLSMGGVMCWGYNGYGQLGDGTTTDSLLPKSVPGLLSGVLGLSSGFFHTCVLLSLGVGGGAIGE